MILEVIGLPDNDFLFEGTRWEHFFYPDCTPFEFVSKSGNHVIPGSKNIDKILAGCESNYINLVKQCLEWDPRKRINPINALKHPWYFENNCEPLSKNTNFISFHIPNDSLQENEHNQNILERSQYKRKLDLLISRNYKCSARLNNKINNNLFRKTIEGKNVISPRVLSKFMKNVRVLRNDELFSIKKQGNKSIGI